MNNRQRSYSGILVVIVGLLLAGALFRHYKMPVPGSTRALPDAGVPPVHSADLSVAAADLAVTDLLTPVVVSPLAPLRAVPGDAIVLGLANQVALLPEAGGPLVAIGSQAVTYCMVDRMSDVLWYTQADPGAVADGGTATWSLYVQDLRHPSTTHLIATGLPPRHEAVTDYRFVINYDKKSFGRVPATTGFWDVELRIGVTATPTLESEMVGCSGDNDFYCRDMTKNVPDGGLPVDPDESKDESHWPLLPKYSRTLELLRAVKLVGADTLRELAQRAAPADLAADDDNDEDEELPPSLPRMWPGLKPTACQDPSEEKCGQMKAVAGTGLATIYLGESQGDFWHVSYRLYDPKRRRFIEPCNAEHQSKNPLDDKVALLGSEYKISQSGKLWLSREGEVCRPGHEPLVLPEKAAVCGMLRPLMATRLYY